MTLNNVPNRDQILIFVPTYNERENVSSLVGQLVALGDQFDFLFLDDNSPDGTGSVLDALARTYPRITVIHRSGKQGIGTAHQAGIAWSYDRGYRRLVTMDADFTHSPDKIPDLIAMSDRFDVVVGTRYQNSKSLTGWNLLRKFLTHTGHFLTSTCLGLKYDATGAFRLYSLDRVPRTLFQVVGSAGYSFFFESLHVINLNKYSIGELSIALPPRTYGHSKMSYKDVFRSVKLLAQIWFKTKFRRRHYIVNSPTIAKEIAHDFAK
jgi:dolichol-phosphate mannosyltransferase